MKISFLKRLEHGLKRVFFAATRLFLKKGRDGFKTIDPTNIRRVLFVRPDKLGDMIISLPVFHNLKKLHPHLQLYLVSSPRNVSVIMENENIAENFLYSKRIFRDITVVRKIRRLGVDAVIDMVSGDSVTSLFLTQFCSPRGWRIGRGKNRHCRFYDLNFGPGEKYKCHAVDATLGLLEVFEIDLKKTEAHIPPTINQRYLQAADDFQASLNGSAPGGIIGLNISAGRPTRVWPDKKNTELIDRLLDRYPGHRIIISSDPSERGRAMDLAGRFPSRVNTLPEGLNLLEVAAIINRMKLLITPDTSLVHIARSFKVPVVGLYTRYKKNLNMWRPYNQQRGTVISDNDYNIYDIEVDRVVEAVTTLLPPGDIL